MKKLSYALFLTSPCGEHSEGAGGVPRGNVLARFFRHFLTSIKKWHPFNSPINYLKVDTFGMQNLPNDLRFFAFTHVNPFYCVGYGEKLIGGKLEGRI